MAPPSTSPMPSRKPVATLRGPNPLQSQPPMNFVSRPIIPEIELTEVDIGADSPETDQPQPSTNDVSESIAANINPPKIDDEGYSSETDQPHPLSNIVPRPIASRMGHPKNGNEDESSTTEPFPLLPYEMPDAYTIPLAYFLAALPRADYWRSHYLTMNNPQMPTTLPFQVIVIGTESWEEHDFVHARHILGIDIVGPGVAPLERRVRHYSPARFVVGAPTALVAEMFMAEEDTIFFDGTDPGVDYAARRAQIARIRWSHLRCQVFDTTPGDLHVDVQLAHIQDLQMKRARDFIQQLNAKEVRNINAKAETAAGVAGRAAERGASRTLSPPPPVPGRPVHVGHSAAICQVQKEPVVTIVTGITRQGPNNALTISRPDARRTDHAAVMWKSSPFTKMALFRVASKTKAAFRRLGKEYQG
ncbi:hypothetical protein MMC11_006495 [Xylographa trunciseda]|nr:hypothetical protein [Xylographa trunciseda]